VPTFCLDELAELKELDEVLKRKQLLQKKNQSEILEDGLTVYINTLILKSQRFPGRGKVSSFLNNAIGISSGIIYENTGKLESTAYLVCIEQASQFLQTEQARYLNHLGFKIEVFDETPKNDSSGKIKHAFVLLTDKSGEKYIFDPWKGYVQKYKDEEFINSKGKRLGLKYYNSKFY
jgi:hypothetical protein